MTREEAVKILRRNRLSYDEQEAEQFCEAYEMAISALEKEPKYCDRNICIKNEYNGIGCDECEVTKSQQPCEDAISRDAVLNAICDYVAFEEYEDKSHTFTIRPLEKRIDELPSVTPIQQPCDTSMEQALLLEVIDKFLPTECGDAISRDAVKEIINDIRDCISVEGYCAILERLKKLPPVTPSITRDIEKSNFSQEQYLLDTDSAYQIGYEKGKKDSRRKGHWIEQEDFNGDTYYDCSECKESFCLIEGTPTDNLYNFCPNCGAEMVEPQESEDKEC